MIWALVAERKRCKYGKEKAKKCHWRDCSQLARCMAPDVPYPQPIRCRGCGTWLDRYDPARRARIFCGGCLRHKRAKKLKRARK